MRKGRFKGIAACGALILILTGCGSGSVKIAEGMQAVKDLDYQTALACFEEAETQGENARLIARGRGLAYMGLTDYGQAITFFEEALGLSDGIVQAVDYDLNYYLAASYIKNGLPGDAEKTYSAVLALKPNEEDAFFLRGNVRLELGKYEEAQADFDKVMAMDAENYDRLIQIYEVLDYYGYREAGLFYLETALQSGESKMTAYDRGRIYYYMGDYQKACLELEQAKDKGGAEAYLYLGKAYEATGDYTYASNVYNAYLEKDTSNAMIYNQLGLCEMKRQDYEKALAAFQAGKNVENNTSLQTLSFNELVAYEYLGEYKTAAGLLESYLQAYPDDEEARREYGFLSTR